jgi:nucleotide-binding universal stress UspA family protein
MTARKDSAASLRRLILAIDTSDASAKAVAFVLTKFQPDRSTEEEDGRAPFHVSVLHVIKRQPLAPIAVRFTAPWIKSERKVKDAARRLVNQTVQQLLTAGFTAEPIYKIGDPAEEIMKVAAKQHADMIVMGAKGLSAIDRILLGSVSTRVVQYANCPVLVVR